ncbi:hypothetical protein M758_5G083000, partial [Ceratodon purpureus]
HSSDSDEDWDNLEDWPGGAPALEGVIAPALRENAISPTASWDEDDEPWPTADAAPGRGVGTPRLAPGVRWDDAVAGGDDVAGGGPGWRARPPRPPAEGVVAPQLADERQVDETFAWAPEESWEPGEPSTRGRGRPRSEAERLEELQRAAAAGEVPTGGGQGWVVPSCHHLIAERGRGEPPSVEGVVAAGARGAGVARTFNVGEGDLEEDALELEQAAGRGIGVARSEEERLDLVREEEEGPVDDWVRGRGFGSPEMRRATPEAEGVLGEGPREDGAFAETFGWEGELGEEWGPEERAGRPMRGTGVPVPPEVRREQDRLPMTAYELELLQAVQEREHGGVLPGDWAVNLPRGDAVVRGDEVEAWHPVLGPGGPLPPLRPGYEHYVDPNLFKGSDATPSSFNTDKQHELMKDISMRFLPDFASDENRALNIMIQEAERQLREIEDATQEQDDRTTVMEDHMKRVQEEITATQQRVEAKKKEILTEEHLKTMTTFQAARLKREVGKMETEMHEMMEHLRNFRAAILVGNDKLEKIREVQQWSEQELEQWVQAALQKDEDYVALESYHKYDDTRLKALRLEETMCSGELAKVKDLLEAEMSETQSYQVALDKAAVEFRALHGERQEVIRQWEEAIELVHKRDVQIHKLTEEFSQNQQNLRKQKRSLDEFDLRLYNAQEQYAEYEVAIRFKNLDAQKLKTTLNEEMEKLKRSREALVNIKAEHLRTQHKYAKEIARKAFFQEEIARQKSMYQDARQKLKKMRKKVEDEYNHLDTLEKRTHTLEKLLHTEELNLKLAKKEVADLQERHYHGSHKLYSLRAAEGDTMHEIKGGKSIAKTLINKIAILEIELLKKEEKLYAADFQIQLLEGKVGRASGERSNAEEVETTKQVKLLEDELATIKREEQAIDEQMKSSLNDMRKSSCRKEELELKNKKLNDKNAELSLECDAGMIGNKAMTKEREEVALEADLLQMEVQRLTDLLHSKADEVFNLDRLKQRLTKNMEDRKAEVDSRQEMQKREMKMIAEELHDLKLKRQNLILKIDKLQCKYGCLVARMKSAEGEELTAEFFLSQMKTAREDIHKRGLTLSEELKKAKIDVKFLESAEQQITTSNNNLRTSLTENERTIELEEEAKKLKEELQKARDRARFKRQEERSLLQDVSEVEAKIQSKEEECAISTKTSENLEYRIEHARKGQEEQTTKRKRAAARLNFLMRELRDKISAEEARRVTGEFVLSEMRESTKDVLHKLNQLAMENPDYAPVIKMRVQAQGFKLPTGPRSARSGSSGDSVAGTPGRRAKGKSSSPSRVTGGGASTSTSVLTMEFKGSGSSR